MDRARHIMRLLEEQSLIVTAWGIIYFRPLPKNRGLMFRVSGNRFSGLIKVRYEQADIYDIIYIPSGKGEVKQQKGVNEVELVNKISEMVGQSPMVLDFLIDMYLIK
jgi:hypothetical protein